MIPKATEDTITSLLRDELIKLGVKAELFPSVTTPSGLRKPDILCSNGGSYPLEAKYYARDLFSAIAKVQNDYLKHHELLNIKGGFAILYPEVLSNPMEADAVKDLAKKVQFKLVAMFPPEDPRPFKSYDGKLGEVAYVLAGLVLTPTNIPEPSIDIIIKSLREAAMQLLAGLRHLTSKDLLGFFGGEDVFKNILQYEEDKYPVEELKMGTAYLLVNQILFYHAISRFRPGFEPIDIDHIREPKDLKQYFSKVMEVNYKTVFSYDVATLLPPQFTEEVKTIVSVIQAVSPEKVGSDLLGTIFHDLIPFETRKNVAAFYTNVLAAELLASLSIDTPDARVDDLSVGSGGLIVAAYRRKRRLLGAPISQDTHKQFVEKDLLGVDVMPFAANTAACNLALQAPQFFTDKVRVAIWDSTDLRPGKVIPSVAELKRVLSGQTFIEAFYGQTEQKGVVALDKKKPEEIKLDYCDTIIMNPPFTRQERIPENYKKILNVRFKDYKEYLAGQFGYYGYFVLLADSFLRENGKMALVLPATVLRVKSCEGLRRMWSERYHIEYIITTSYRSAFSESVMFREILLVAEKNPYLEGLRTAVIGLKKLPTSFEEARDMAEIIRQADSNSNNDVMEIRFYSTQELRSDTENWYKYVTVGGDVLQDTMAILVGSVLLRPFGDVIAAEQSEILRGIETARGGQVQALTILHDEKKAIKSTDVWVFKDIDGKNVIAKHRFLGATVKIPLESLKPAMRRVSQMNKIDVTEELDYVIAGSFPGLRGFLEMSLGKVKGIEFMNGWKSFVRGRLGNLALVRRMDLSAPGTIQLAFYSDKPMAPPGVAWTVFLEPKKAALLALWANSTFNLIQLLLNRKETRGAFMQVDKYVLSKLLVPDLSKLSKNDIKSLLEVFGDIKDVEFPCVMEQLRDKYQPRKRIDACWFRVLGFAGNPDELLDRLYGALFDEIDSLRKLMAEGSEVDKEEP